MEKEDNMQPPDSNEDTGSHKSDLSEHSNSVSANGDNVESDKSTNSSEPISENENKTNLIVNYLPPDMTQGEARDIFASIGEVESCKLIRDKTTGESLGYAFVKYTSAIHAEKAIKTLNGFRLQNKTIKVSMARPNNDALKGANLYICNLPMKMTPTELENLFSPYGKIITARILYDNKTGLSRGVAFLRYDHRDEAKLSIKNLNGLKLDGAIGPIKVKFANPPSSTRLDKQGTFPNYLIKPSPPVRYSTSISQNAAPPVTHNVTGSPQNYFGQLSSMKYLKYLSPSTNNYMQMSNMPGSTSQNLMRGWCIFIYNLGPKTTTATLWQLFGPFGAVQTVKVIHDTQTNKCKGFGFVSMVNYEEALVAVQTLHGITMGNRILQVTMGSVPNSKQIPYQCSSLLTKCLQKNIEAAGNQIQLF